MKKLIMELPELNLYQLEKSTINTIDKTNKYINRIKYKFIQFKAKYLTL